MTDGSPQETNASQYFLLTLEDINLERAILTTLGGQEVEVRFQQHPLTYVVKDLGRWARRNLGLKGRTEPGVFTQIIWKEKVLGINHPLIMLIETQQQSGVVRTPTCTFCQNELRNPGDGFTHDLGPFNYCYYCKDEPSWHHGWCCPQNVMSATYRGLTHADRSYLLSHGMEGAP